MRNAVFTILAISIALMLLVSTTYTDTVTRDEALTVAQNWITFTIHRGSWGGEKQASIQRVEEFSSGDRTIGYYCPVSPRGYILVSLLKELAPVKAYSTACDLDVNENGGMTDLLKYKMERILNTIERNLGPIESVQREELEKILDINYRPAWDDLNRDCADFEEDLEAGVIMCDYVGDDSTYLLTSYWHQGDPYNQDVPTPPVGDDCTNPHCAVGCVATAGSQVMHYWNWPPFGEGGSPYSDTYSWLFIPDTLETSSSLEQQLATAELCHEVGLSVDMDYCGDTTNGCSSSATTSDLEFAFQDNFRYSSSCTKRERPDYTAVTWFELIKEDLNKNQPLVYRIKGHAIVCDGWLEDGSGPTRQYHMNYGWANSRNDWYTVDALHQVDSTATIDDEYLLEEIRPAPSIAGSFSGTYSLDPSFRYRYFTRDATCATTAEFSVAQRLQFLPHVEVKCVSSSGYILFNGSAVADSEEFIYSINEEDTKVGIKIYDGDVKLNENGGIRFFGERDH